MNARAFQNGTLQSVVAAWLCIVLLSFAGCENEEMISQSETVHESETLD
jgi:hypothetical protein